MSSERRKVKRREILEKFSFYICVPKIGFARHKVNDISELGIGFTIETLGGEFKLDAQEQVELHFYLNQSLYLPLKIQVMRRIDGSNTQEVGAVFLDTSTAVHQTFLTLVKFLDQIVETGISPPP
ncbi:MAG: PilZ domain-containing protein [Bdellovibrionales bacterium]|nr:PilZ domain-containing protein [Bdellovibrionales bacterium]